MHPLYDHYQRHLLGRLKTRALVEITGTQDVVPSQRELLEHIMHRWKRNSGDGRIIFHLVYYSDYSRVEVPAKMSVRAVNEILDELRVHDSIPRVFAEGRLHGLPGVPRRGCLVLGHNRPNGEPGYYAAVYDEEHFPSLSYLSIVPPGEDGPARVEALTTKGWQVIPSEQLGNVPEIRLALTVLKDEMARTSVQPIRLDEIYFDPSAVPPTDPECLRRVTSVIKGKMTMTEAFAPLQSVRPYDLDQCLKIDPSQFQGLTRAIAKGRLPTLLAYWEDGSFVMSDDYQPYLAYRQARVEEARLAIMGHFPADAARAVKQGGMELLPPIMVHYRNEAAAMSPELKQYQLERRLREDGQEPPPYDYVAAWLCLAELLDDENLTERALQDFLFGHPVLLSLYGTSVDQEIRLGDRYRIDLIIRAGGVREEVTLVELEQHQYKIFTQEGRPHYKVTHAKQQVEDWIRWLKENPTHALAQSIHGLTPKGLVIIGRSADFTEDERSRLAHLNESHNVQIITYDELLDRLGDVILQRLSAERI